MVGVQGLGLIEGEGLEMVLTLGTGMGCALFYEGTYIPNLELAHAPFKKGRTFEDYVGNAALEAHGKKKWNRHVAQVIATIDPIWNPDRIYLGGGNVKHLKLEASPHVRIGSNAAGLLGGIALWEGREGLALDKIEKLALAAAEYFDVNIEKGLTLLTIRHYDADVLGKLTADKQRVLLQQTPTTVQVLMH